MEQQSQLIMMIFLCYVLIINHVLIFFSPNIFEQLSYTPDDLFCPIILPRHVFHLPLCNLALTGMCRDVCWMIIELQARWMAVILLVFYPPLLLLHNRQVSV
jgi:hypothetical protein